MNERYGSTPKEIASDHAKTKQKPQKRKSRGEKQTDKGVGKSYYKKGRGGSPFRH